MNISKALRTFGHRPVSEPMMPVGYYGREHQQRGYSTGIALANHIAVAHNGTVDPNCRACAEIQAKQDGYGQTK